MSVEENVQIVKDFFAAMGGHNKQDLLALVAEDIEWIVPGEDWPLAGTHRGRAELALCSRRRPKRWKRNTRSPQNSWRRETGLWSSASLREKSKPRIGRSRTSGSSTLPFETARSRASTSTSTRKHWRGPRRSTPGPSQVRRVNRDGMTRYCADQHPFPERAPTYDFRGRSSFRVPAQSSPWL